jgi:cytochrome b subunit of formate dehydrogenase/nitrate/TMAO reductase-like tetraheme cytochrome c subunit
MTKLARFPWFYASLLAVALALGVVSGTPVRAAEAAEAAPAAVIEPVPNDKCLECHGIGDLTKTNAAGVVISLVVNEEKFKASVHATNNCVDCHRDLQLRWEHPDDGHKVEPVSCGTCHTNEGVQYAGSIHGFNHGQGGVGATCSDCHGSHEMAPVKNLDSPVFKLNLPLTCAKCHNDSKLTEQYRIKLPQAASQYLDSIHGKGLMKMGLIVAPSCNDCHGVHDIIPGTYTNSPVFKANISRTCGKCHVKIEDTYNQSVHGQLLMKGDPRGPVCTDCHSAHAIETPRSSGHFKQASDERCGKCHEDRLEHYRETYHGKAMALGRPNAASDVAACFDCHGHHDVLPHTDPKSKLSAANIVDTCKTCHPDANPGFVQYQPHANPLDGENYPALHAVFLAMTGLLIGVFTFFGGHTLLWLFRSAWVFLHDSKKFREARVETSQGDEWFTRFAPYDRFLHFLVVTSFLLLVITGMPLKFFESRWARVLFDLMGGPDVARSLHHFGAIITFLYFFLHLSALAVNTWQNRGHIRDPKTGRASFKRIRDAVLGPDSMVPTLQDWKDFVAHQKWFFGRGAKPQFDRWTYWEKFDYFAVFWGVFAIGVSGLIMWFPEFFTRFMPGWIINIALIVHSDEALLAAGFIFTIHFFNTHFRLEKFPMDTVIFSGRISKAEMMHERRRWYDRLVATGRLDQHRVQDEWLRWKSIARTFGYLFFGTGVILLVLILVAMGMRLF